CARSGITTENMDYW
nr:immunoglobulin heavy chain junction region [Mus musculus]